MTAAVEVVPLETDPAALAVRAAAALARGAVLAIPTESSYGLAVDPRDERGVEAIRRLKGRPEDRAMPVVVARLEEIVDLGADAGDPVLAWAAPRWPAALSVVVRLSRPIAAGAADGTAAVRIPAHDGLRALLAALGRPLTATSANASGEPPHRDPRPLVAWLERRGADAFVVDGGVLPGGLPSTLVAFRDGAAVVLRPGRVAIA